MDALLELLQNDARLSTSQLAERLGRSEVEVAAMISDLQAKGAILGYHAVVDPERAGQRHVSSLIEVQLTPARNGGLDRPAPPIAPFDPVPRRHLISGGYDPSLLGPGGGRRRGCWDCHPRQLLDRRPLPRV